MPGGALGELMAGCIGGALSAWNTPFEVARIEANARIFEVDGGSREAEERPSLMRTLRLVAEERGVGGLFCGLTPRVAQACYQTVFLVTIPRLLL